MAGRLRYWKEKEGRFWARMAVPGAVQEIIGRSEIIEPLGGDRREALKKHPAAVARLRAQIIEAEAALRGEPAQAPSRDPITTADFGRAVWQRYTAATEADESKRAIRPGPVEIEEARKALVAKVEAGDVEIKENDPLSVLDATLDFLVVKNAGQVDRYAREARLAALKRELAAGETHQVQHEIDAHLDRLHLSAERGSAERAVLANQMMRAEIEALERTIERDSGNYRGQPTDPIIREPAPEHAADPVNLTKLSDDYIRSRIQAGFMKDAGKRQKQVVANLRAFLKHNDARKVTKKDLLAWRDSLLPSLSAKTVNDAYLSNVRSLFKWAHDEERLPENIAETVRQAKPKRIRNRERGYTAEEAVIVLKACRGYEPKADEFGRVRETPESVAAKRWAPLLCAFSGARISEITQLRAEDIRKEGDRWVMRITPEAGTVKTSEFRDVPLHRQIVSEGFIAFVESSGAGPLFHRGKDPATFAAKAQRMSNQIADWLRLEKLTPEGVQPSHGWRHRLKTQGRELGLSDRVIDAIQGHAGRTASDGYGDVTIPAKLAAIDALPEYALNS